MLSRAHTAAFGVCVMRMPPNAISLEKFGPKAWYSLIVSFQRVSHSQKLEILHFGKIKTSIVLIWKQNKSYTENWLQAGHWSLTGRRSHLYYFYLNN